MKKTVKVNVSGMLFNLDEDAYEILRTYLNKLELHFSKKTGSKEIIEDIERGIADMMNQRLDDSKTIISIEDIEEIIGQMGDPREIDDDEQQESSYDYTTSSTQQKRLYRDPDDKVLAGICSGISYYLNVDVAWVRILFIVLFFVSVGFASIIYLILWIAVPEALSTAQKLEMRGESVTIDNIEKKIKEEINNIGDQLNNLKNKHFNKKKRSAVNDSVNSLLSFIVNIFVNIAKIILIFFGIIFTLAALSLLIMLIPAFVSGGGALFHEFHQIVYFSLPDIIHSISSTQSDYNLILFSIIGVAFIPLLSIIIGGLGYLLNFRTEAKGINKALGVIWIVAAILLTVSIFITSNEFEHRERIQSQQNIDIPDSLNNVYIKIDPTLIQPRMDDPEPDLASVYDAFDNEFILYTSDSSFYSTPEFETYSSKDSLFHIEIVKYSHGERRSIAKQKAKNIIYNYTINDTIVHIPPVFSFPQKDKWRNQRVRVKVYIPNNRGLIMLENNGISAPLYKEIEQELHYFAN
jgi:phage shock protein PspC (stress-responsive transcriptional regulator)